MITNYYTLFHVAAELEHDFAGKTVNEIFTQHRGELVISLNESSAVIIIGCEPANNFIYERNSFSRARRNSADLFTGISGAEIEKIFMHPNDRQLHIRFADKRELVIQLFGSKANVLLADALGTIQATFLKKNDSMITGAESSQKAAFALTPDIFRSTYSDQLLTSALKRMIPQFGPVLVRELLTRTELNGDLQVHTVSEQEIERVVESAKELREELLTQPSPRIYFEDNTPVRFSIIPLRHMEQREFQQFVSISEAIQRFRASLHHEKSILQEKADIVRVLERERDHIERTLNKIQEEAEQPNRAVHYELFGKLLISQLHTLKKGDATAVVEDFVSGSNELVEIPLDAHLTPAKNAERYFEKAEKSRHASEEQRLRLGELKRQLNSAATLLSLMEDISTTDDLRHFEEEHRRTLSAFGLKAVKSGTIKKEEPLPFRVFTVAGGFQVWAGKSGENNDLLSTRHTAKNDLWFHARGVGGSHVVLKIGTGKGEVSKQAMDQAAGIAAYYSKMKKSKLVPVTMCEGKYVRKPKGVPAGTVTVEREKTIFAEPVLPPAAKIPTDEEHH
ncbi:MAG: fibronectin-binding domain-containing protein [Ignavibacteriae bacterium]|nr:MAG: fibronectin-binding domain-containing protein [Ignavibacteriota bacterium]